MKKMERLYQTGRNIFKTSDIRQIWQEENPDALKSSIKYFADQGRLFRVARGLYSLNREYEPFDLAAKLISPSYVSLETALQYHGIVFQYAETITCFALYHRERLVGGRRYLYHAMANELFYNPTGIIQEKHYAIASAERAIADWVNLYGLTHFDNLRSVDAGQMRLLLPLYGKKTTQARLLKLIKTL
jgi:predicted transcriptional regulator of viral defense system